MRCVSTDKTALFPAVHPVVSVSNVPFASSSLPSVSPFDLSKIIPTGCPAAVTGVVPAAS